MVRAATDLSDQGATVLISMSVRPGCEAEYQRWQRGMDEVARRFPGFEATELYPPSSADHGAWVVVFRFSELAQLTSWLDSREREALTKEGEQLFDGPASQEVLAGEAPVSEAVTAVIPHGVRTGREKEFERWQEKARRVQERSPGFMGYELFRPVPGLQDKWVAVVRYDTRENLDRWLHSDTREKLLGEGRNYFSEYEVKTVNSAFSGWFTFDRAGGEGAPPNWKQAMSVLLALYPAVMIISLTLDPALRAAGLPMYLAIFLGNVVSVAALTWLLMPVVNRVFAFWLAPGRSRGTRAELSGGAMVVACYLAFIAIFGWITR